MFYIVFTLIAFFHMTCAVAASGCLCEYLCLVGPEVIIFTVGLAGFSGILDALIILVFYLTED